MFCVLCSVFCVLTYNYVSPSLHPCCSVNNPNLDLTALSMYVFLQECFPGNKYQFKDDGDTYCLIIDKPRVEDSGKYTLNLGGVETSAFLTVERE